MTRRRIRAEDLRGFPGLTRDAVAALILRQPKTAAEAIRISRVGRSTARRLLERGLLTDPESAMRDGARQRMDSVGGDDRGFDDRPDVLALFASLRDALPQLEALLDDCSGHWGYEDLVYRLYHQSFKVFGAQKQTLAVVDALQALAPTRPLNQDFMTIVRVGTGHVFERGHNQRWLEVTRPIIEAFLHARFFLEMAVLYGQVIDRPLTRLPSGWAAFLYLYNLR